MIRKLDAKYQDMVIEFLDEAHELNLIMINDIQRFGLENLGQPFQGDYHGVFAGTDIRGVSVIYNFGSMFIYAPDAGAAPELIERMTGLERAPRFLSAREAWGRQVLERLSVRGLRVAGLEDQEFMSLGGDDFRPRRDREARFARPRDLDDLTRLARSFQIEYFGTRLEALDALARAAINRMEDSGIAVVELDGRLVSKAEIMARTDKAALIGGVFTEPEQRGKGYCLACMSLLCGSILSSGRRACLNVSKANGPALHVYRELGFRKLDDYLMAHFTTT